jgi:hypothetical protein
MLALLHPKHEEIQDIVITANLTPRKCLGFQTPFQASSKSFAKTSKSASHEPVALRTRIHGHQGKKCNARNNDSQHRLRYPGRLHKLGPKPLSHFLTDIEAGKPFRPLLEQYAALPVDLIRTYGGDQFWPSAFAIDGRARS